MNVDSARKPELGRQPDRSHWLWRGLRAAFLFNANGGLIATNEATGSRHGITSPVWSRGGMYASATGGQIVTDITDAFNDLTVTVRFFSNSSAAASRLVDKNYQFGFWVGSNPSNAAQWGGGYQQSSAPYGAYVTTPPGWNTLTLRHQGTSLNIIANGGAQQTSATVVATACDSTPVRIAQDNTLASKPTAWIDWVMIHRVALSYAHIVQLHNNPFDAWVGSDDPGGDVSSVTQLYALAVA